MCARGMLLTDISFDFVRSEIAELTPESWQRVCELFAEMEREGARVARPRARRGGRPLVPLWHRCALPRTELRSRSCRCARSRRTAAPTLFRRSMPRTRTSTATTCRSAPIEIVNCRLQAVGRVPKAPLRPVDVKRGSSSEAISRPARRSTTARDHGWLETPVYARAELPAAGRCDRAGADRGDELDHAARARPSGDASTRSAISFIEIARRDAGHE